MTSGNGASPPTSAAAARPSRLRRGGLLGAIVVAIIAVAVVTDLPTSQDRAQQAQAADAFMKDVNGDLASCTYAVDEAFSVRTQLEAGAGASDRAEAPSILADDNAACSLANPYTNDLDTGIGSPGTTVQSQLGSVLAWATAWTVVDAPKAITAIEQLVEDPTSKAAATALARATTSLDHDRALARSYVASARSALGEPIVDVALPSLPPG